MNKQCKEVAAIAAGYLRAGIVPIPIRLDGSKAPAVSNWKLWQTACPTPWQVREWFKRPAGIAIICGAVSFGLEVLDFDDPDAFEPWRSMIRPELFGRLAVVETAGGGIHCLYRCSKLTGNTKIAMKVGEQDAVRIETRGEGGYIVAAGSPLEVHASGQPYCQVLGPPLPVVNHINPDERRELWQAAASFDCRPPQAPPRVQQAVKDLKAKRWQQRQAERPQQDGLTPWDDFDRRGDWRDILEPHGWTSSDGIHWTRPGKDCGTSGKVNPNSEGLEILSVYSNNAGALSEGVTAGGKSHWGKTRAFTALNHGGNASEAAKALHAAGYGSSRREAAV